MIRRLMTTGFVLAATLLATAQLQMVCLDSITETNTPAGIWRQMPAGAVFEIQPVSGDKDEFRLVLLTSDDLSIPPGSAFGTMRRSAIAGTFDAELLHNPKNAGSWRNHAKKQRCTIEIEADNSRLIFKPYKSKLSVNFSRLLPYLFRFSVKHEETRPEGLDGAVRIAPESLSDIIIL